MKEVFLPRGGFSILETACCGFRRPDIFRFRLIHSYSATAFSDDLERSSENFCLVTFQIDIQAQ
ncbi:histidine kinase [Neisseria sicca]|uniref:histidine kinase n=1 Tax=Neisseria sicca TaxID=490 RepID=UPI0021C22395|nr:histidine kinase [Neisseria sicca]